MALKKAPTLTEIINKYSKELDKQADTTLVTVESDNKLDGLLDAVKALAVVDNAEKQQEAEEKNKDTEELVSAVDTLQDIAKEAAQHHNTVLAKEAQVFGELFATSVLNTLQNQEGNMPKLAQIYDSAYAATMAKLAEEEAYNTAMAQLEPASDENELEEILAQMSPEEQEQFLSELEEDDLADDDFIDEDLADEPITTQEDLEQLAASAVLNSAQAAHASALAAGQLVDSVYGGADLGDPELDEAEEAELIEALPKVASEAYELAMARLSR